MARAAKPPPKPDVTAFRAEVGAMCPAAILSDGAKALAEIRIRGCRLGPPLTEELRILADLLRATPRDHPDWIRIVDRMAGTAFQLELDVFRACTELSLRDFKNEDDLARARNLLPTYKTNFRHAQALSRRACDALAREPTKTHAPCAFQLPEKAREEREVCREEPRSIPPQFPSLVCEPKPGP